MDYKYFINAIPIFCFGLLYLSFLFTPKMSRKDIIFGVSIPRDRTKDEEIIKVSKAYSREITIFTIILLILYFIILNTVSRNPIIFIVSTFVAIAGYFIAFLRAYHKIKAFKAKNNLLKNKKQVLYVNTELSKKLRTNAIIPSYWFVIPGVMGLLNLILPMLRYNELPSKIGIHYNIAGVADRFVDKSVVSVFISGLVPLILVVILTFTNYIIAVSKNKIDASQPISSSEKLYKFKKINSVMIYVLTIFLISLISIFRLNSLRIISVDLVKWIPILIVLFILITLVPILLSFKLGQGGSNLKDTVSEAVDNSVTNVDDDEFWKLGSIYYNPNDPSMFVEKRFGVGWTVNFGNKVAAVLAVGFILFVIGITVFSKIFSK